MAFSVKRAVSSGRAKGGRAESSESAASDGDLRNLFFEAGSLKRIARSGWWLAGIKHPESVAEHTFRTAFIAYFLAREENLDEAQVQRAVLMALFHDFPEVRCNDLHKVGQTYFHEYDGALSRAAHAQSMRMPPVARAEYLQLHEELEARESRVAVVVKDADILEVGFQAKEYLDCGIAGVKEWIVHARQAVKTKAAKRLLASLEKKNSSEWFKGLKNLR